MALGTRRHAIRHGQYTNGALAMGIHALDERECVLVRNVHGQQSREDNNNIGSGYVATNHVADVVAIDGCALGDEAWEVGKAEGLCARSMDGEL